MQLQNQTSAAIQLSKPVIFGHRGGFGGGFGDVDATWRWGPPVSPPLSSLSLLSSHLALAAALLPRASRARRPPPARLRCRPGELVRRLRRRLRPAPILPCLPLISPRLPLPSAASGELRAARAGELAAERGPLFPPLSRRASLSPPPPISCAERSSPSAPDRAGSSSAVPPSNSDSRRGGEARHHAPPPQLPPPARRGTSGAPRQRGVASRDGRARSPVRPSPRPTSSSPAEQRRGHGEWSRGAALPPSIRLGGLALPPRRRHQHVHGRGGHSVVELRAERRLHGARGREEGGRAVGGGPSLPPLQAAAPLVTLLDRHNAAAEDADGGERGTTACGGPRRRTRGRFLGPKP